MTAHEHAPESLTDGAGDAIRRGHQALDKLSPTLNEVDPAPQTPYRAAGPLSERVEPTLDD